MVYKGVVNRRYRKNLSDFLSNIFRNMFIGKLFHIWPNWESGLIGRNDEEFLSFL
jgi:hypothetical protein